MKVFSARPQRTPHLVGAPPSAEELTGADNDTSSAGNGHPDPEELVQTLAGLASQMLAAASALVQVAVEDQEAHQLRLEKVETLCLDVQSRLSRLDGSLDATQTNTDALRTEQTRTGARLAQAVSRLDTLAQNLDQLRLLTERLVHKSEELVQDFIARQVTDPLFKEFAHLYGALSALACNGPADWTTEAKALAEGLEHYLDTQGLALLSPAAGEPFDPRTHQPIQHVPTPDHALHACIAQTYHPGLRAQGRTIQLAQVAVFTFRKPQPETTQP